MTDEEGGTVQRMANLVGSVPSARHMGSTMKPAHIHTIAHRLATRMKAAGVTMDLAPVLDLDGRPARTTTTPSGPGRSARAGAWPPRPVLPSRRDSRTAA